MRKGKLIEILSSFSKDEVRLFDKFIISPYFLKGRDVSALYSLIKKHHPDFNSQDLDKSEVFHTLFPGEKFNEKKLKNLTSELTKLAEQFLVHDYLRNNDIEAEQILITQYRDRKSAKLFFSTIKSLEKKLDKLLIDEYRTLKNIEEAAQKKANFYFWLNDFDNTIENELKYTEYYTLSFLTRFLKRLQSKNVVTSRYNKKFSNPLFDSIQETLDFEKLLVLLKEKDYSFTWLIEIYYHGVKCTDNTIDNEVNFRKLKELFYANISKFSEQEKQGIFVDLSHYCIIQKDEKNNSSYLREQFEIYKKIIEYYSHKNDFFNIILFRSIMTTAVNMKELEWLKKFIEDYSGYLEPQHRNNMEDLAWANYYFIQKDFNKSLDYLGKIKYDIFLYKIDIKLLYLKIYYELDLYDEAYSMVDAFKHFINENKEFGKPHKEYYSHFIKIFSKLLKMKESGDVSKIDEILDNPDFQRNAQSFAWLLKKAQKLKNAM